MCINNITYFIIYITMNNSSFQYAFACGAYKSKLPVVLSSKREPKAIIQSDSE